MTDSNQTMNITKAQQVGMCEEKCAFSYKYQTSSNCIASNLGDFIKFTYDEQTTPPAYFNNIVYKVQEINLYSPSIHRYNGQKVAAELVIRHFSTSSGAPLLVCIPMTNAGIITEGSNITNQLITQVVEKPLNNGDPAMKVNIDNYNLTQVIPDKPYFYYFKNDMHYIAFGVMDALSISNDLMTKLRSLITEPMRVLAPRASEVFFNKEGPLAYGADSMDGEIYIDCQPTGNSQETEEVTFDQPGSTFESFDDILNNPIFYFLLLTVIIYIIIYVIFNLDVYIGGGNK